MPYLRRKPIDNQLSDIGPHTTADIHKLGGVGCSTLADNVSILEVVIDSGFCKDAFANASVRRDLCLASVSTYNPA